MRLLRSLIGAAAVISGLFIGALQASQQDEQSPSIQVSGKLIRIVAIGGETTGWAVRLAGKTRIDNQELNQIEVDPKPRNINLLQFQDADVEITGYVVRRRGVERKSYPVMVIESIRGQ